MYQDLHSHTIVSDGKTTYQQSLDICQQNNISVVAFTDHDLVPEHKELKQLEKLRKHETAWIVGIEISCAPPKELAGQSVSQLHVVGLFINPNDKDLVDYGHLVVDDCTKRAKQMVKAMSGYGFDISFDDVLSSATGKTMQRPHLVSALLKKPDNIEKMKFFINNLKKQAKKNASKEKVYQQVVRAMKAEPENPYRQPFYQLFFSRSAPYDGAYFERRISVDLDKAVGMIRAAGGIAILAHWSECRHDFPLTLVEKIFKENRIDGAEIVYDLYRIYLGEKEQLKAEQEAIKKLVEKYHLLASGGSDAHDQDWFARFVEQKWMAEQTIGMAQKMIAKIDDLCLDWTTVKV